MELVTPHVENTIPVLGSADVQRSLAFYEGVLGFQREWGFDERCPHIGSVQRDRHPLMISLSESTGITVWIGVSNILPIFEACLAASANIVQPPTNQWWAYEFRVKDPDGNILWFGSDPLSVSPTA
jgi:catechol 2,3-dioxygenase-like lactoylglutathione lyase family enzyme